LRKARHSLEEAHRGINEKRVIDKINELEDLLYDFEE
jgi:hypothetical protein